MITLLAKFFVKFSSSPEFHIIIFASCVVANFFLQDVTVNKGNEKKKQKNKKNKKKKNRILTF